MVYYKPFYEFRKTFATEIAANDELKNVQAITMMISKNRIGTAKVEQVYKLNFNRG